MTAQRSAFYVARSANEKTGPVAVTYASIRSTCPSTCPLRNGGGCYAENGKVALHAKHLDDANATPIETAIEEANAIDDGDVGRDRPLRLHVSGDAATPVAARLLASAARRYKQRGGGPVWSYTHAWRVVSRKAWGDVSILASVDSLKDGPAAIRKGYAPAGIVARHPANGRAFKKHGIRWVPCPAQTRDDVTCTSCRLCFDPSLAKRKTGVVFEPHGAGARKVHLRIFQKEPVR